MVRICLITLLFLPLATHASDIYTLPQLIELALKNRPEMKIAAYQRRESESQLKEAKSYYYPQLDLNLNYTHLDENPYVVVPRTTVDSTVDLSGIKSDYPILAAIPDEISAPITVPETKAEIAGQDIFRLRTELKQPIFTGGKIRQRVRQARLLTEVSENQRHKTEQDIAFQVKSLYFTLVFAERGLKAVKDTEKRLEVVTKFLENVYKNYVPKEGEKGVTKGDYLKAQVVLAKVRGRASEVQKMVDAARKSLVIACGLEGPDFSVSGDVEKFAPRLPAEDMGGLKKLALAERPELKQLAVSQEISSAEIKRARAGFYPDVGVFGYYEHIEDNFPTADENTLAAGVSASIPIFNGMRTVAELDKAKAAHRKVKSQRELMELAVFLNLEELYAGLNNSLRKMEAGKDELAHARERRQLESESYLLEASNYKDYLEALEDEVNAETALLRTKAEYYVTLAELQLACGL